MLYRKYFKRIFDIVFSLLGLALSLPLVFLLAIPEVVCHHSLFFIQTRPGLRGRPFKMIKFRTMNERKDTSGKLLPDKERITKIGRVLRSLSIDEIPQLINVLKGDMSIVGPRPLLMEYLPLYNAYQVRRHEVRPGITGYAQVHGRNLLSWEEKFEMDVLYVDNISFKLDIKIILLTVIRVIKREGVNSSLGGTMYKYVGPNKSKLAQ